MDTFRKKESKSRREFIGKLAVGASAGLTFITNPLQAGFDNELFKTQNFQFREIGEVADKAIKSVGKLEHPVGYDISSNNPWGLIWSNIYFLTNDETGTPSQKLGVLNVLRHHGMVFGLNDETISKYSLGEFFGLNDPITNAPAKRNPYYIPQDGVFPLPGLDGIKGLAAKGTTFYICDMARKVYAQFVAQKVGTTTEVVYDDFVKGTLPEVIPAPSGVWVLGRLAENGIAYIDASVG